MIPAFAYLRVSGSGQIDGDGFPRQEQACRDFAAANGYEIVRVFREEGVSGTYGEGDRPALLDLLKDPRANTIIVERLDRLARDLMISETILRKLQASGFIVLSTAEPDLNSVEPTRVLIRQIMAAIAEWDRKMIVGKLRVARDRKRNQTGRCEGAKPFGLTAREQSVIRRARELRNGGMKLIDVVKQINREGMRTKFGYPWRPSSLCMLLKREERKEAA